MSDLTVRTPWHLWVVGVAAVLFNSIGVFDFVMSRAQGAAYMESASMPADQIAHYMGMPAWMIVVWGIGVWGAILGSVLILMRRKLAVPVFVASLTAFIVSLIYTYVLEGAGAVMGVQGAVSSAVITVLLLFFIWYARMMGKRGVLR